MSAPVVSERARLGLPAFRAACAALESGPLPREQVVVVMMAAGLARLSARNLLRQAILRGDLLVTARDEKGRPTLALPLDGEVPA